MENYSKIVANTLLGGIIMSIKVIIANNSDILFNSLSNIALENESKIEIINVPADKLSTLIYQIKERENLIVLDSITSVSFCTSMLKNAINRANKRNIIILVIDSKHITNIISQKENHHWLFWKKQTNFSLLDTINLITDTLKDTLEIEKNIDNIFWRLGLTSYLKGTIYLKDAILLAYSILDMNELIIKVAKKNEVTNYKGIRSVMDKSLNTMLDNTDIKIFYEVFEKDYDGRKISLKYFIDLCIRFLEKQRYCCLEN